MDQYPTIKNGIRLKHFHRWEDVPGNTSVVQVPVVKEGDEVPNHDHHNLVQVQDQDQEPIVANVDGHSPERVPPQSKKPIHWTEQEHMLFLEGLKKYGKGDWKNISKLVGSKDPTQVASHGQKYFLRQSQSATNKKRKRPSIHDMTLNDSDLVPHPIIERQQQNEIPNLNVPIHQFPEMQQAEERQQQNEIPNLNVPIHQSQEMQQAEERQQQNEIPNLNDPIHQSPEMQQAQEQPQQNEIPNLNVPIHQYQEMQQAQEQQQQNEIPNLNVPIHQSQEMQQEEQMNVPMHQFQEMQQTQQMQQQLNPPNNVPHHQTSGSEQLHNDSRMRRFHVIDYHGRIKMIPRYPDQSDRT